MSSVQATVADYYQYVVGVGTHAATHSYAVISAPADALIDQAAFPTTAAGLRRAREWIARRTGGELDRVLIAAEGTGSYGAVLADSLADSGYRIVEAPTPRRERGRGKTDSLDAVRAARSCLVQPLAMLCDRRAGEVQVALQVLTAARDQLNADRLRCLNALTALVRSHDLGIDARRALTGPQITTIAGWRRRDEPLGAATARTESSRLAKKILALDEELADNRRKLSDLVSQQTPELLALPGVGAITAAVIFTVWSHPGRIRSEAAFAQIAGTCPIPASSGNTVRHRLNRGGDRRLNRAINTIVLTRMRTDTGTRAYLERRQAEGKTNKEIRRCLKRYTSRQIFRTLTAWSQSADGRLPRTQLREVEIHHGVRDPAVLPKASVLSVPCPGWWGRPACVDPAGTHADRNTGTGHIRKDRPGKTTVAEAPAG